MKTNPLLIGLFSAWAAITAVWIVLMIYRGVVGMKEEDQVFLHKGEESMVREQQEIAAKLKRVGKYATWAGILSVVLFLAFGAAWVYEGMAGGR